MKLALTLEADSINAQTLNMGRIVVDVDGVNLTELINKVAENGYSLRVVDDSDQQSTCTPPPQPLPAYAAAPHISRKQTTPGCTRCHTRPVTSANQNGFILQVADICYVPMRGHTRFCGLNAWGCQKCSAVWLSHLSGVMASVSFIWMPALNACRVYLLSTGNQKQHEIINH
ncbi:hypothetical protein BvCmsNSP058_00499 [Escherichia coli]|uniref:YeeW-like domain-containing protein n=3 Tax=Escherichia coli TaxID=562 RepID=A0AAN3V8C9_ECOLX|nr:hypothetical protein EC40967_0893 [Escherichia coli 4.0967]GCJ83919.1 hypothetical protein BvCmsB5655_05198 [Escherichia coli]GCK02811.1 hypothetical protein BvCmsB16680_03466 [Escherichia coli]GCQ29329.1 hypothetical protein BvCmsHHP022_00167 [Escherichia coli]GDG77795.1 hypothetical protein BvCmsKKP044_04397 [Escherichia coli]